MAKPPRHPDQADLFEVREVYPVRAPQALTPAIDFNRQMSGAMSLAVKQSDKTREQIADEMTRLLGYEDENRITVALVNAWTSAAKDAHNIHLVRFRAFVRVTGANWLWQQVLDEDGLTVLEGPEAHFARAAILRKQGEQLLAEAHAELELAPAQVRVRRGRR